MKKLFTILLVILLTFSLVACGSSQSESSDNNESENEEVQTNEEVKTISGKEAVANIHVRRAIAMAIDKTFITEEILNNGSIPADYYIPKNFVYKDGEDFRKDNPEGYLHYNVEKAQEEWKMAKEELDFDEVEIEIMNFDSESSRKIMEYIQAELEKNLPGASIAINKQPFKNKLKLAQDRDFEIDFAGWGPDYVDPTTFLEIFRTNSGHNTGDYNNEEFTNIVNSAMTGDLTTDIDKRWEALKKAEKIMLEEVAIMPIYQKGGAIVQKPYVSGIYKQAVGGDYIYKYADSQEIDGKKVLRLIETSDTPTMDTNKATNQVSFIRMANVLEGLYTPDKKGIKPGVAKDYEVSEDGKTYTFHLREEAKWENGDQVTAHDFEYSWKRLVNPDTGAEYAYIAKTAGLANAEAITNGEMEVDKLGVKAIDNQTLEVQLDTPVPYFVELVAYFPPFFPVNEDFVNKVGEDKFGKTAETVLANGPFTLDKWELGYGDELAKNDTYWNKDIVKLDRVTFRIVKDNNTAVNLYEGGKVDRVGLSSENVNKYQNSPNFSTLKNPTMFYLQFNTQQK
ncbi:MAG: ABC transporter substrate-binding protein [Bacillota bacterium]